MFLKSQGLCYVGTRDVDNVDIIGNLSELGF